MTERQDDPSILDGTNLYRGIRRDEVFWDSSRRCWRPSSAAFQHLEMSVAVGDRLSGDTCERADELSAYPGDDCVGLTAKFVRNHNQIVVRDPVEGQPAHGLVVGDKMHPAGRRKDFYRAAVWELEPTEPVPPPRHNRLPEA